MIIDTSNKNILSYILCMLASQEQNEGQIYFDLNVEIFFFKSYSNISGICNKILKKVFN